jgi:cephalosporin hydroxylase
MKIKLLNDWGWLKAGDVIAVTHFSVSGQPDPERICTFGIAPFEAIYHIRMKDFEFVND